MAFYIIISKIIQHIESPEIKLKNKILRVMFFD